MNEVKKQPVTDSQRIEHPLSTDKALKRLFTVKEAALYLGRSVWSMRDLIWSGKIKVVKDGKRIFIDRVDLDGYIERNKAPYS